MDIVLVEQGLTSLHLFREGSFGKDKVKFCQKQDIALQVFGVRSSQGTEGNQDFLDFLLLFHSQFRQFVVQFDNGHWLNEKGGSGGTLVVDHALKGTFVFLLHRQAVTAVAHGDNVVTEHRGGTCHGGV